MAVFLCILEIGFINTDYKKKFEKWRKLYFQVLCQELISLYLTPQALKYLVKQNDKQE